MATWEKRGKGYRVRWRDVQFIEREDRTVERIERERSRKVPDLETAKRLAREIEQEQALGRQWVPPEEAPRRTLRAMMTAYVDAKVGSLAPDTVSTYAKHLDTFLAWVEGRSADVVTPASLSKTLLMEFHAYLLTTGLWGRPRTLATANKHLTSVQLAWAWAADDDDWIDQVPRARTVDLPTAPGRPVLAPTWAEMDACVNVCSGPVRQIAVLLRYTGLRVQQVMRLTWDDVDLRHETLTIRGELGKSRTEKAGRIIPISAHLVAELAGWGRREGWIVPTTRAVGPRERTARARNMAEAWRKSGVREAVWRGRPDHAFRKGITSRLKAEGADTEAVEYLLGRRSAAGAREVYLDPDALPLRQTVAKIPQIARPGESRRGVVVAAAGRFGDLPPEKGGG